MLGFFVNEVARSNAYAKAIGDFSSKMQDAAKDVGEATARAEAAATKAESLAGRIDELNQRLQALNKANQSTNEQIEIAQNQFSRTREQMQELSEVQQRAMSSSVEQVRALRDEVRNTTRKSAALKSYIDDLFRGQQPAGVTDGDAEKSYDKRDRKFENSNDLINGDDDSNPFGDGK